MLSRKADLPDLRGHDLSAAGEVFFAIVAASEYQAKPG
jgi:hypothetical protein